VREQAPGTAPGAAAGTAPWIGAALHDLFQPLTALGFVLYLGKRSPDGVRAPTTEELMATIDDAQGQCERLSTRLRAIQDRMYREG
jgi:hypothetical protein